MRTVLCWTVLLAGALAVCGGHALAAKVVLSPVAAVSISTHPTDGDKVTSASLPVGFDTDNTLYRGLMQFDLSGLPAGATITKATLRLYQVGAKGVNLPVYVYRTNKSWDAATVTWAGHAASFSPTAITSGGGGAANGTWVTYNVLILAKSWYSTPGRNFGLMLRGSSEGGDWSFHRYASKDQGDNPVHPRLVIEYTP